VLHRGDFHAGDAHSECRGHHTGGQRARLDECERTGDATDAVVAGGASIPLCCFRGRRLELAGQASGGAGTAGEQSFERALAGLRAWTAGGPCRGGSDPEFLTPHASSPIVAMVELLLASAVLMAVFTFLMLQTRSASVAWVLLFCVGLAMAPVFPTALAMANDLFKSTVGTAVGILTTCGWIGLAVSSRIIGSVAGTDQKRLKKALLLLPGMSLVMIAINVALLVR
jgi:hypothetical protein